MNNNTVFIIAGPTAVGKSEVALALAQRINGEIINCDSVQLYKYLDIGSAKPSAESMRKVPHHLYGIVAPDYNMSVATYQKLALTVIDDVLSRGKTPIVVGGTGLYINSILYDMDFAGRGENKSRREELEEMAEKNGANYMHEYLSAIDPDSASRIHPNNTRKVIRAIEAFEAGDGIKPLSDCPLNSKYNFKLYALTMDREWLYAKINSRVIELIKAGLFQEVEGLLAMGYNADTPALKGIGYKELIEFKNGKYETIKDATFDIMKNTRHYAKRQITWLKRYNNARWVNIKNGHTVDQIVDCIYEDSMRG